MKNQFYLPIGDWSKDGHGECEKILIESDSSLEDIREAHFKIEEKTGIDIHEIANEYEDNTMKSDTCLEIIELGLDINNYLSEMYEELRKDNILDEKIYYIESYGMGKLWVDLLNKTDKSLNIKICENKEIPIIHFYGFDRKGRHIKTVGYGTLGG